MKAAQITQLSQDGFKGYYYTAASPSDKCMIVIIGDEGNDFMNTSCAKWLTKTQGCNVLCLGIRQKAEQDSGVHSWPIEYIESAVLWLKNHGTAKIGALGMSMQAVLVLTAASILPDISLVIALTPADYIPWGFVHGKIGRDSHAEWPSGTSTFTWHGRELPWQSACLEKKDYWNMFLKDKKKYHEMHTITIFEHSENVHPVAEETFIHVENINGRIIFVGSKDDSMWNTSKYINRMVHRLEKHEFPHQVVSCIYPHGTHLLVPERMLKLAIPLFGSLIYKMFEAGRRFPAECRKSRIDLDRKLSAEIRNW